MNEVPMEDLRFREFTPADMSVSTLTGLVKYLNSIPRVMASIVEEPGSPLLVANPATRLDVVGSSRVWGDKLSPPLFLS
jgi:hypothetical protein